MAELITTDLVVLDADLGRTRDDVVAALAARVVAAGRAHDVAGLRADLLAREAKAATGMKGGIAIPHARSAAVTEPTLAFARLAGPVDFGAKDGGADLVFVIAVPEGGAGDHLAILADLARGLVRGDVTSALREARDAEAAAAVLRGLLAPKAAPAPATAAAPAQPVTQPVTQPVRLVAVTSCPTGIAHTYMAAEALEAAAARAGVEIAVETQGSAGSTPLPASTIAAADAVIFATEVGVRDRHRFAGLPVLTSGA